MIGRFNPYVFDSIQSPFPIGVSRFSIMFFSDQNRPFLQPRCKDLGRRGAREDHGDQVAASVDKKTEIVFATRNSD